MMSNSALRFSLLLVILVGISNAQDVKTKDIEAKVETLDEKPGNERILQLSSSVEKLAPKLTKIIKEGEEKVADAVPVVKDKFNSIMSKVKSGPGFFSIFLIKKTHKTDEQPPNNEPIFKPINSDHPPSLILFKIIPNNQMGGHLLGAGGSDDIDHKFAEFQKQQQHLLGGGDDDIDKMRMKMTITGTGEDVNQDPFKHFIMPLPFFNFDKNGMKPFDSNDVDSEKNKPTLIIRTDDGSQAFISNDFGSHSIRNSGDDDDDDDNGDDDDKNYNSMMSSPYKIKKCVMRHLLRLKASLYYRSVLHMLFISGTLLFVLLITMLIVRTCRRQRMIRQYAMDVASIDTKLAMGVNPPPGYDELINDNQKKPKEKSSMINSLVQGYRNQYTQIGNKKNKSTEGDNVSVSSLPNYDEHAKKMQNIHENV